jgi:cytochrome c peroxidase
MPFDADTNHCRLNLTRQCRHVPILLLTIVLTGCSHDSAQPPAAAKTAVPLSAMAQLGRKLFFDPSLSASGTQSCASCHSPAHAFGPSNDLPAQLGGPGMNEQGARAVPSLRYISNTPGFSIGPEADGDGDANEGRGPRHPGLIASVKPSVAKAANNSAGNTALIAQGGFFWDGRASTLPQQALGPLLNPVEMANPDPEALAEKLRALPYAGEFRQVVDPHILDDKRRLPSYAVFAIARYELEDPVFHPYDSKYDQYLQGRVTLSKAEQRGLQLYDDPKKGNCAACHPDKRDARGNPPAFTDYEYEALGVPRNRALKTNADPAYFDLGICGPARRDIYAQQPSNCGLFKTPSLRNVATRQAFFHNGVFHTLEEVLHFYVERETSPEKFYPVLADGRVKRYDDLPPPYQGNIDIIDAPFDRHRGEQPALNDAEIKDLIAFLKTLSDGYRGH